MRAVRQITTLAVIAAALTLSACGGDIRETCDEPQPYQAAKRGEKIKTPEGLDTLDGFKEMPLPKAETPPRAEGSPCIDQPPVGLPKDKK
jgi:uncharacterized lipoprotein